MKHRKGVIFTAGIAAFFVAIFFWNVFLKGEVVYCCDNLLINIPAKMFLAQEFLSGRFPLWNPYLFSGTPFLADINLSVLYPTSVLYLIVSPFIALTSTVLLHFFLAFVGMVALCREWGQSTKASLVSAIVFAFSGAMVVYTGNIPMLQVASLLPWVFWSIVRFTHRPTARATAIVILLASLQVIAGHPQLTLYSAGVYAAYILFQWHASWGKKLYTLLILGIGVFAVSGVQGIPFLEFAASSTRVGLGPDYATEGSLPFTSLVRFIFPSVVGDVRLGMDWWQGGSAYGYMGSLSLLLAWQAARKRKSMRFFAILSVLSLLLALGKYTPMYSFFSFFFPFLRAFRVPAHFLLIYTLSVSVLAGQGFDVAWENSARKKYLGYIGAIVIGIFLLFWIYGREIASFVVVYAPQIISRSASKLEFLGREGLGEVVRMTALNGMIWGVALLLFSRLWKNSSRFVSIAVIFFLFAELFFFSRMNLVTLPLSTLKRWEKEQVITMRELAGILDDNYRVFIDPALYPSGISRRYGVPMFPEETQWQIAHIRPNTSLAFYLHQIDGYASMIYGQYQDFFETEPLDPTGITIGNMSGETQRDLALRYIITTKEKETSWPGFTNTKEFDHFVVLENTNTAGRVRGRGERSEMPGRIDVAVDSATTAGRIAFSQTRFAGWRAFVDGKRVQVIQGSQMLSQVDVPQGSHIVQFLFDPVAVKIGLVLSSLGLVACLEMMVQHASRQ